MEIEKCSLLTPERTKVGILLFSMFAVDKGRCGDTHVDSHTTVASDLLPYNVQFNDTLVAIMNL